MDRLHRPYNPAVRLPSPLEKTVYALATALWLSGLLWLLFEYFLRVDHEFGPARHWLQPWWLKLHGGLALFGVWGFGVLWSFHIRRAWGLHRHRYSGGSLFSVVAWLALSGLLLYYVGNDSLRGWISLLHWLVGLAGAAVLATHVAIARPRTTPRAPDAP